MHKTTDGTRRLVRFLRERGIKYIYTKETLQNEYIKKYDNKEFSNLLDGEANGNLLKYFDKFFSYSDNLIGYSFAWSSTKNGHEFWRKMFVAWADYLSAYSAYINH